MKKNLAIVLAAAVVVALPFLLRRAEPTADWRTGDPVLVVISPHNEAIRYEFGRAFAAWHAERYGRPARVEWRNIGGTTEIMRYLEAEYVAAFRAGWQARGNAWSAALAETILDRRFNPAAPPADGKPADWDAHAAAHTAFRGTDDPGVFSAGVDLFFGGGTYDHGKAAGQGLTVPAWPATNPPPDTIHDSAGNLMIPEGLSGESWRTATYYGNVLSAFGICGNYDRLADLGVHPPARWEDLTDPRLFRQVGVADPTKSGSIAKAFEMIVQEQCLRAVTNAGFTLDQIAEFETRIGQARLDPGLLPADVPPAYQQAIESGWLSGLNLIRRIGANARYFTDAAGRVPVDVAQGAVATGIAIDFYGRYQTQVANAAAGQDRMFYLTPAGGSSISADPISLLRGAPHRELAVRFIEFTLRPEGQRLWNYAPGTPGGPARFALRRTPIRRDFYPAPGDPGLQARCAEHARHTTDRLTDPIVNVYALAGQFTYQPRWTTAHFGFFRDLIRAMCLDSSEELQSAWQAICRNGGPAAQPRALTLLERMPDRPEPLTWASALRITHDVPRVDYLRDWTVFFRGSYDEARKAATP